MATNLRTNLQASQWQNLRGKIADEVFRAPKTCGDPSNDGQCPEVDRRIVNYIDKHVAGHPWSDYVALVAAIASARRHDFQTVKMTLAVLQQRFSNLFAAFNLNSMDDWDAERYMISYLKGEVLPEQTKQWRSHCWVRYMSSLRLAHKWLRSLPDDQQAIYERFIPPLIDPKEASPYLNWMEVRDLQRQKRKAETDAVLPQFADLRGEAHFRFNRMARLKQACREAVDEVVKRGRGLPFDFSYEETFGSGEGAAPRERLLFRVWDRRSFVLAHKAVYSKGTVKEAKAGRNTFSDEQNLLFFECVGAENLIGDAPPEGLWFEELLRRGVLASSARCGTAEEVAEKQNWLREWGYGEMDEPEALLSPFRANEGGVLISSIKGGGFFLYRAQKKTGRVLFSIEPLYRAAAFGLLAINIFTTTGMRINELMQIRLDGDCLVQVSMPAPPGAQDKSLRVRHVLRLIPKGERGDNPHDYFISQETVRLMGTVARMVYADYGFDIDKGDKLPSIKFSRQSSRYHRFGKARYLFQHGYKHLGSPTITGCMRFLLHGMVFLTTDGKRVVVKAHLLRHTFATHAAQVEGVPLDVLGIILKHKSLAVTDYYSQPTESVVAEATDRYFARIATHVSLQEAVLRSPEEIGRLVEEAQGKVGALSNVIGGECVINSPCIGQWACMGCAGHAPDPVKRSQVEEKKRWAETQMEMALREGLTVEFEQMKKLVRDCEATLREMAQIEAYRKDEKRDALVQLERRRKRPSRVA